MNYKYDKVQHWVKMESTLLVESTEHWFRVCSFFDLLDRLKQRHHFFLGLLLSFFLLLRFPFLFFKLGSIDWPSTLNLGLNLGNILLILASLLVLQTKSFVLRKKNEIVTTVAAALVPQGPVNLLRWSFPFSSSPPSY